MAELRLLPSLRSLPERAAIVAPGFSCRQQIRHFAGREAHSAASLVACLLA